MANKFFSVKRTEKTVAEILVCASSIEEAEEVAQMDHVDQGKEEVLDCEYHADLIGGDKPIGRIAYTKEGYINADGLIIKQDL